MESEQAEQNAAPAAGPGPGARSEGRSARLGGARADFVASLGRKVNDARGLLAEVQASGFDGSAVVARDELQKRLRALATLARLLRFDAMVVALADADAVLTRAAGRGALTAAEVEAIACVLDDLPALAWGDAAKAPADVSSPAPPVVEHVARTALVVGDASLAEALANDDGSESPLFFEGERLEEARTAVARVRHARPDLVVVDADVEGAAEAVEALADDPTTATIPLVVVGAFAATSASRFVALGVTRALTRPLAPGALRRACEEALRDDAPLASTPLGDATVEQLGDRLADEVRRALVEGVDAEGRAQRLPLGDGAEILGVVRSAVARVRELVAARSGGAVRFAAEAGVPSEGGVTDDAILRGRRVLVADDDPGVTWFFADLLKGAGCIVHEALDGATALDVAHRVAPDLVLADILMPELDGFALARALARDVALRTTPVILLSWKEDLLQRVRELGAHAAGYLRKESDARTVLGRAREVLRPRARTEARLREGGEVRGRLEGLTMASLLDVVCAARPDARIVARDTACEVTVDVRDGAPRAVRFVGKDARVVGGERALAALLALRAGRFSVTTRRDAAVGEPLAGTLAQVLAAPLANARAALQATTGARTIAVERIELEPDAIRIAPTAFEPARALVARLAAGASPRAMLLGGEVDPILLEEVLADLATRGLVAGVWGASGDDLLAPARDALLASAGSPIARLRPPSSARIPVPPPSPPSRRGESEPRVAAKTLPPALREELAAEDPLDLAQLVVIAGGPPDDRPDDDTPSTLADAVIREISDREGDHDARARLSAPISIIEPSRLRPRSSNPPFPAEPAPASLPPDAMVPASVSSEALGAASRAAPLEPFVPADDARFEPALFATPDPPDPTDVDAPVASELSVPVTFEPSSASFPFGPPVPAAPDDDDEPRTPLATVAGVRPKAAPRRRGSFPLALAMSGVAIAAGAAFLFLRPEPEVPAPAAAGSPVPAPTGVPVVAAASPAIVTYAELPAGAPVPPGEGLLELTVRGDVTVRIDGEPRGAGPSLRVPLTGGPHEVRLRDERGSGPAHTVEIRAGRVARVDLRDGT